MHPFVGMTPRTPINRYPPSMTKWEYATVPLLIHATKQILDQWGEDGWELVTVLPGPTGEQMVAYLKRPKG
ncbi:putative DUF4177 family protein [Actinoalloteichus hymeniacidonis]|uniref:DUF4177 family protein n=2 Tax=Pseudonocardiaceae TaxID=2070 RepID=A0AAC9HKQ0_9PSEU|nr:putative DUF4177 family protein [Actinoalloteichus hymeniacidonis]